MKTIRINMPQLLARLREEDAQQPPVAGGQRADGGIQLGKGLGNPVAIGGEIQNAPFALVRITVGVEKARLNHPIQKFMEALRVGVRTGWHIFHDINSNLVNPRQQ